MKTARQHTPKPVAHLDDLVTWIDKNEASLQVIEQG